MVKEKAVDRKVVLGVSTEYCCWQRREDGLDFWVLNQPRLSLLLLSPWTLIGTIADRSRLQKVKSNEFTLLLQHYYYCL